MLQTTLLRRLQPRSSILHILRKIHASQPLDTKSLPPRPKIDEESIEENFLKGSGPGGQKINKTSSAVQLKHVPTGIVVKSQATRSRSQNRKYARQILAEKLDELEKGDQSRSAIKASIKIKKKASASKKKRRKYRALEAEKAAHEQAEEDLDEKLNEKMVTDSLPLSGIEASKATGTL